MNGGRKILSHRVKQFPISSSRWTTLGAPVTAVGLDLDRAPGDQLAGLLVVDLPVDVITVLSLLPTRATLDAVGHPSPVGVSIGTDGTREGIAARRED